MQISKEFLMEAVGLSLLVALALIGMQLFQRSIKITEMLNEEQEKKITEMEEYEIVKYDGLFVDGMTVISYIKTMVNVYGLPVHVTDDKRSFTVSDTSEFGNLRNMESDWYINPVEQYECTVKRDENGAINNIMIKKVKGD